VSVWPSDEQQRYMCQGNPSLNVRQPRMKLQQGRHLPRRASRVPAASSISTRRTTMRSGNPGLRLRTKTAIYPHAAARQASRDELHAGRCGIVGNAFLTPRITKYIAAKKLAHPVARSYRWRNSLPEALHCDFTCVQAQHLHSSAVPSPRSARARPALA
jgi:hypothetical protein